MTYATLQADAIEYLHRQDLTALMPRFISLAESFMFRELNLRDLETSVTGTTATGIIALPGDFGSMSRLTITRDGTERALDYANDPQRHTGGTPAGYALESNAIRIYPTPVDSHTYTIYYTVKIDPLSDSNTTNWLLDNAADLYLYASALEGAKHTRDMKQVEALSQLVSGLLDSVRRLAERKGQPARGGMQIKLRTRPL
jgi:hypothetical protein